jgi:DNA-binding transcriptional LysR family regulator
MDARRAENMNVNHLKAFHEVAKAKSFTLAAQQMHVSQPTLSTQVKSMEKRFAVPLIKRNKKAFELTGEGEIVFQHAERIFTLIQNLKKDLENFKVHNIIIGSTPYISDHVLPDILRAIQKQHGDVNIQIYTGLSQEALDKVVDYEYDLAVLGSLPYPDNIVSVPILKAKLLFISREDMGGRVSLRQLADYPIILPEEGSATRDYLIREFAARNLCTSPTGSTARTSRRSNTWCSSGWAARSSRCSTSSGASRKACSTWRKQRKTSPSITT